MQMISIIVAKGVAEIEIRIPNTAPQTKDIWLLHASRLIWEVWSRMGWFTTTNNIIRQQEWKQAFIGEDKEEVMAVIERLLKIEKVDYLCDNSNYEEMMKSTAKLANKIEEKDLCLMPGAEVFEFRKLVIRLLLIGVIKGLNPKSAIEMEYFSDPITNEFQQNLSYRPMEENFSFHKSKNSFVSVYSIETNMDDIPLFTVHLNPNL